MRSNLEIGLVLAASLGTSSCTTAAYRPDLEAFLKSSEAVAPLIAAEAKNLRAAARTSYLLERTEWDSYDSMSAVLCTPLMETVPAGVWAAEITRFAKAANDVATPPKERTFWQLAGSIFGRLFSRTPAIPEPLPGAKEDSQIASALEGVKALDELPPIELKRGQNSLPDEIKKKIHDREDKWRSVNRNIIVQSNVGDAKEAVFSQCYVDVILSTDVNDWLLRRAGITESGGGLPLAAVADLYASVEATLTKVLVVVDDQMRARALREFFSDEAKVNRVRLAIAGLEGVARTMDTYRRLRAVEALRKTAKPFWDNKEIWCEEEKCKQKRDEAVGKLVLLADTYDVAFAAQVSPAFAKMRSNLKDLEDLANCEGETFAKCLRSAYDMAAAFQQAVQAMEKWTSDQATKDKLKEIGKHLRGET